VNRIAVHRDFVCRAPSARKDSLARWLEDRQGGAAARRVRFARNGAASSIYSPSNWDLPESTCSRDCLSEMRPLLSVVTSINARPRGWLLNSKEKSVEVQVSQQRAHSSITKTRNSFRAFFNARKPRPFWKEMQAVRQEVPSTDYALMCTVTEDNSAYPFPGLGNTFPRDAKLVPNYRFQHLRPLDLTRESALQVARINYQAQNVADALKSLAQINKHLTQKEFLQAEEALLKHRELYGLSFILLKKDLLLSLERQSLPGLNKRSKALTAEYRGSG
jgi:hypothetical protein